MFGTPRGFLTYLDLNCLKEVYQLFESVTTKKKHAEDSASSSTTRPLTRVETSQQELYIGLANTTIESGPMPKVIWKKLWRLKIHDN